MYVRMFVVKSILIKMDSIANFCLTFVGIYREKDFQCMRIYGD